MTLEDRVVLVTGTRRIGGTVAEEMAARGAHISVAYRRSADQAEGVARAVRSHGRRALVSQADVSNVDSCRRLVDQTVAELGRLDVLINMASSYARVSFDELTEAAWDAAFSVDVRGAFLCSMAAVPHLRAGGAGRIINFSDWVAASHRPRYRGYLPYYVAQAAVVGLTEALALELADDGILVNAIAPGPIRPPADLDPEAVNQVAHATPVGRWGGDQEIVKVVASLVESDFITGETIRVDGGRHLK